MYLGPYRENDIAQASRLNLANPGAWSGAMGCLGRPGTTFAHWSVPDWSWAKSGQKWASCAFGSGSALAECLLAMRPTPTPPDVRSMCLGVPARQLPPPQGGVGPTLNFNLTWGGGTGNQNLAGRASFQVAGRFLRLCFISEIRCKHRFFEPHMQP